MTANPATATHSTPATSLARLATLRRVPRRAAGALAAWWDHIVTTGQLGPVQEREVGRHTGART